MTTSGAVDRTAEAGPPRPAPVRADGPSNRRTAALLAAAAVVWVVLYAVNRPLWDWVVGDLVGLDLATRLGHAIQFFAYDTVKIMLLIVAMMFVIGLVRTAISPERVRSALRGKHALTGYLLAAVLGSLTPFCSCSSIPVFIGLAAAGVPLGVAFTFLVTSPMINQVGVVMLLGMFGWRVPALYVVLGMGFAVVAGLALSRLPLDRWVEPWVLESPVAQLDAGGGRPTLSDRVEAARDEVVTLVRSIWVYVVIGIALGAGIHGWVPDELFAGWAGSDNLLALPIAAVAGLPMYANVASVVPLVEALYAKGVALGTLMAFMTSVVALSLPSLVMLRRLLKLPLLALFAAVVGTGAMLVGLIFNLLM